ncbi:MAG: excinuclease ABC subunit UvrC [Deltaproteobacteria bacterium]|nr:excinuclease ABC subunit UvrC [Deltaproteobacteria bacterium]
MKLSDKISEFPKNCGVYWMKDAAGEVLYVGKAKKIRLRVQSYFKKESRERYQIDFLMRRTVDIEYLVTDSEKEALLLENTLIKKYKPRYNIFFKDDKSYASLKLNVTHSFPSLSITRDILKDGSLYFGPYASAGALRKTLDLMTRNFQLRTCSDHEFANRSRPCLEYHIGRCTAPCVGKTSADAYAGQVEEARLFLGGQKLELLKHLKEKMALASTEMRYEEAARIRDLVLQIEETLEKQKVVHHGGKNYDAVGYFAAPTKSVVCVLMVREGLLSDQRKFVFLKPAESEDEFLSHFLFQYYGALLDIPPEIYLQQNFEDRSHLQEILEEHSHHLVKLMAPQRGKKVKMVALAVQNAQKWAEEKLKDAETLLKGLEEKLSLPQLPRMIECVDISNLQGQEAVGSLVCFEEGKPLKSRYRKFKIRLENGPNDYAMMYEVLSRRFKRILMATTEEEKKKWELPDLLLVDGGKGHLQIALKALADLGLHQLPLAAIAKGGGNPDKIYIPNRMNPVSFRPNAPELLYLMRIRDEAHRFGITYHRALRSKKMMAKI